MKNKNQTPPIPGPSGDLYRDARDHRPDLTWSYAAKGFFRRGETSVLFGPSNCGKSALVCHLGNCVVTGSEFFGARVTKGVVVHVGAEAPVSVLDRVHVYDPRAALDPWQYIVRMAPVDLSSETDVDAFVGDLAHLHRQTGEKIVLVVFDTLARSIGTSDENCASAMTGIANAAERIVRQLKTHVMLVHHTGKDTDRGGRGSSALRGAVDTEVSLAPLKCGAVIARQEKQRTMPKSGPVWFRTESHVLGQDEDGEDRTTVKALEISEPPKSEEAKNGPDTGSDEDERRRLLQSLPDTSTPAVDAMIAAMRQELLLLIARQNDDCRSAADWDCEELRADKRNANWRIAELGGGDYREGRGAPRS